MREKYESLALVDLKEIAKARGIKGTSAMKKADLVEAMLREDEKDNAKENGKETEKENGKENDQRETYTPKRGNNNAGNGMTRKPADKRGEGGTDEEKFPADLDSGITAHGILEVMPDGFGFIRSANFSFCVLILVFPSKISPVFKLKRRIWLGAT